MKKNNIIIIVVVLLLLLLLGAGGYLMLSKKTVSPEKTTPAQTNTQPKTEQTSKSLLELIKMGQNLRCTYTSQMSNGSTEGTVYVSGQNVRADFTVKGSDGKTAQTSMIRNGDTSYIWGASMLGKGIKMTVALDKITGSKQASQYVDPNQKVDYNCTPWNVDSTLLTPPSNITFTDMTNLLAPKETGTPAETKTNPSTNPCSEITDANVKAACESALQKAGQ